MVTLKTSSGNVKEHDNRHTFITNLAESGQAADETIEQLAGHVSKRMLKHYSTFVCRRSAEPSMIGHRRRPAILPTRKRR
jgi:integrase